MTEPKMIRCHDDVFHELLPCVRCGKHAGGCLQPLNPWAACVGCKGALCPDCYKLEMNPQPSRCKPCGVKARAPEDEEGMTKKLSDNQLRALRSAGYAIGSPVPYGFLVARILADFEGSVILRSQDGPVFYATCGCGKHPIQPLDGRACNGLIERGMLRDGPHVDFGDGKKWVKLVTTAKGRAALEEADRERR